MGKELVKNAYIEAGPIAVRAGFDPTANQFIPEVTDEFCVVVRSGWGATTPLTVKCARRQPTKDQSSETVLSEDRQVPDEPGVVVAHGFAGRLAYITEPASETLREDDFYPVRRLHVYSGTPGQPMGDGSPAHDDLPAPVVRPAAYVQVELCDEDHIDAISALTPEVQLLRMDIKITMPASFVSYSCHNAEQLARDVSTKMFGNSYDVRVFPPSQTDWNSQTATGAEGIVPLYFFPTVGGDEALRNVHEALQQYTRTREGSDFLAEKVDENFNRVQGKVFYVQNITNPANASQRITDVRFQHIVASANTTVVMPLSEAKDLQGRGIISDNKGRLIRDGRANGLPRFILSDGFPLSGMRPKYTGDPYPSQSSFGSDPYEYAAWTMDFSDPANVVPRIAVEDRLQGTQHDPEKQILKGQESGSATATSTGAVYFRNYTLQGDSRIMAQHLERYDPSSGAVERMFTAVEHESLQRVIAWKGGVVMTSSKLYGGGNFFKFRFFAGNSGESPVLLKEVSLQNSLGSTFIGLCAGTGVAAGTANSMNSDMYYLVNNVVYRITDPTGAQQAANADDTAVYVNSPGGPAHDGNAQNRIFQRYRQQSYGAYVIGDHLLFMSAAEEAWAYSCSNQEAWPLTNFTASTTLLDLQPDPSSPGRPLTFLAQHSGQSYNYQYIVRFSEDDIQTDTRPEVLYPTTARYFDRGTSFLGHTVGVLALGGAPGPHPLSICWATGANNRGTLMCGQLPRFNSTQVVEIPVGNQWYTASASIVNATEGRLMIQMENPSSGAVVQKRAFVVDVFDYLGD